MGRVRTVAIRPYRTGRTSAPGQYCGQVGTAHRSTHTSLWSRRVGETLSGRISRCSPRFADSGGNTPPATETGSDSRVPAQGQEVTELERKGQWKNVSGDGMLCPSGTLCGLSRERRALVMDTALV